MKAYPEYKASSIDWLGEIPSHWTINYFKWIFSTSTGITFTKAEIIENGNAVISYGQIHSSDNSGVSVNNKLIRFVSDSIVLGKDNALLRKGDFLFADTSEDIEGCGNCVYIDTESHIYAGYHSIICRPIKPLYGKYIAYLFKADAWRSQLRSKVYGVKVYSITQSLLSQTSLITPPIEEQEQIAAYLDDVTGKIDELVKEKQAQLDDIRAYRASLITETVTRGLNPDAPLKDSGIDWLGEIPAHWKCLKLQYLLKEPLMYGANESPEVDSNKSHPRYIRITDIAENGKLKEDTFRSLEIEKAEPYMLQKGDVLFARSGATVGKTFLFTESYPCCFAGYLIRAKCGDLLSPNYLMYYTDTLSYFNWKNSIFDKSTIQNIAADKYNSLWVVLPPIEEQREIVDFLDTKTAKIDELIESLSKQIEDLAEYKRAVITEAVTGKVDVRDWQPKP